MSDTAQTPKPEGEDSKENDEPWNTIEIIARYQEVDKDFIESDRNVFYKLENDGNYFRDPKSNSWKKTDSVDDHEINEP